MKLDQLYKQHYFFEINRKHQLTNQLTIPIGVLTILGGVIGYIVKDVHWINSPPCLVLLAPVILSLIFLVLTIYFLVRSYYGYEYRYVPTSKELRDYRANLVEYYQAEGKNHVDIDAEIEDFLMERYALCAHHNTVNNDSKSGYLYKANGFLIVTLLCSLLCTVPYLWTKLSEPEKVQKINVVNFPMLSEKTENIMAQDKQEKSTPKGSPKAEPPRQKPEPPRDRLIREDKQPREKR